MYIKELWDDLYGDGKEFLEKYLPYLYKITITRKSEKKLLDWQINMWGWFFEKMDIVDWSVNQNTIYVYSEKQIKIPTQKTVLGETYYFNVEQQEPSKQGGAQQGLKDWFTQKIALSPDVAKKLPYKSHNIFFTYNYDTISDLHTLENYTKLTLQKICKEHNIFFTYDWTWHYAFLASFEPIKQDIIDQVKKELGEYIKNENN